MLIQKSKKISWSLKKITCDTYALSLLVYILRRISLNNSWKTTPCIDQYSILSHSNTQHLATCLYFYLLGNFRKKDEQQALHFMLSLIMSFVGGCLML